MAEEESHEFPCFRCGECCRQFQVLLDQDEIRRLARFLAISPEVFVARYSDTRWPGQDKCLVKKLNGQCPFLYGEERAFICSVHPVKPQACRAWTAGFSRSECKHGLKRYWKLVLSNDTWQGTPENIKAFEDFLEHCKENS